MRSRSVCPALALAALAAFDRSAFPADLLPGVGLHLEAVRYAPVEKDLHWMGWMGGSADLVRAGGISAYISGDVETLIGNTRRAFDASQANYHLEAGARRRVGRAVLNPFFHHVSRHYVDRDKVPAVDWNILGARVDARWPEARVPLRVGASLGHTTLASLVGYRWELTGRVDGEVWHREKARVYAGGAARFVTIDPDPNLVRGDFLDFTAEAGLRFPRGTRVLEVFADFERRNDVFLEVPGARNRALFGFRVRFSDPD